MTLQEIKRRYKAIYDVQSDDEVAHSLEDDFYEDFIRHISKTGSKEQKQMARAILKTKKIDFARWCA